MFIKIESIFILGVKKNEVLMLIRRPRYQKKKYKELSDGLVGSEFWATVRTWKRCHVILPQHCEDYSSNSAQILDYATPRTDEPVKCFQKYLKEEHGSCRKSHTCEAVRKEVSPNNQWHLSHSEFIFKKKTALLQDMFESYHLVDDTKNRQLRYHTFNKNRTIYILKEKSLRLQIQQSHLTKTTSNSAGMFGLCALENTPKTPLGRKCWQACSLCCEVFC